jgi:DHA2 family multidrug resistance protein
LRLFKDISFSAGNLTMFMVGFCLYSSIMLIPLFLQTLMGYDATLAGMVLAPGGVATLVTMPFVGVMITHYDGRKVVLAGLLTSACAMFLMRGLTLEASYWDFVWPRVVLGFGLAMTFVPLTTVTLATIPREEMGNATGLFNLLRNIGGSVGIAVAATLLQRYSQFYQNNLVANVTPFSLKSQGRLSVLKQAALSHGADLATSDKVSQSLVYGMVKGQAGILAYNRIFFIIGLAFLGIVPFLLLLRRPGHH